MANRYRDHDGGRRMRHIDVRSNYLVHVVNVRPGLDWRRLRSTIEDTCGKILFIENFEAWRPRDREITSVVIEFARGDAVRRLARDFDELFDSSFRSLNSLPAIMAGTTLNDADRDAFFSRLETETGFDFLECEGMPPVLGGWSRKRRSSGSRWSKAYSEEGSETGSDEEAGRRQTAVGLGYPVAIDNGSGLIQGRRDRSPLYHLRRRDSSNSPDSSVTRTGLEPRSVGGSWMGAGPRLRRGSRFESLSPTPHKPSARRQLLFDGLPSIDRVPAAPASNCLQGEIELIESRPQKAPNFLRSPELSLIKEKLSVKRMRRIVHALEEFQEDRRWLLIENVPNPYFDPYLNFLHVWPFLPHQLSFKLQDSIDRLSRLLLMSGVALYRNAAEADLASILINGVALYNVELIDGCMLPKVVLKARAMSREKLLGEFQRSGVLLNELDGETSTGRKEGQEEEEEEKEDGSDLMSFPSTPGKSDEGETLSVGSTDMVQDWSTIELED